MPASKPTLSRDDVDRAVAAILAAHGDDARGIAIAVVDEAADLLAFLRTDGSAPFTGSMARAKAYTAARVRKDTGEFRDFLAERGSSVSGFADPGLVAIQGGVVVLDADGRALGAIAVSGLAPADDERLARTGLAAIPLG